MRTLTTWICAIAFAIGGVSLALNKSDVSYASYNSVNAAPVLHWAPSVNGKLPLDLYLDIEKKNNTSATADTVVAKKSAQVVVKHKCRRKPSSTMARAAMKRAGDSVSVSMPDTTIIVDVGREEKTTDTIGPPKGSIILLVDGKEVYRR